MIYTSRLSLLESSSVMDHLSYLLGEQYLTMHMCCIKSHKGVVIICEVTRKFTQIMEFIIQVLTGNQSLNFNIPMAPFFLYVLTMRVKTT